MKTMTECHPGSSPLVPGGSSFAAMHLFFSEEEKAIRVKPSWKSHFFGIIAGSIGLVSLGSAFFIFLSSDFTLRLFLWGLMMLLVAGSFFFAACLIVKTVRKRCRSVFDLSAGIFHPNGRAPDGSAQERFPAIPFSELESLQVVREICGTRAAGNRSRYFCSYELNVVLRNGARYNLLDHGNKVCFAREAGKLAAVLSIPLLDAEGKPFDRDAFLDLAAEIRNGLFFGGVAILVSAVCFCFGGRTTFPSWEMVQTSPWACILLISGIVFLLKAAIKYSLLKKDKTAR